MMFVVLTVCVAVCVSQPQEQQEDIAWEDYKLEFGKVYATEAEEATRYATWKQAVSEINLHNAQYGETFTQGMNDFTDMTDEEFRARQGYKEDKETTVTSDKHSEAHAPTLDTSHLPSSVNWVSKGYVTEVKNQGNCGSCYSFAATGALEGAWFKKTGNLISLSEQQIIDCSGFFGNDGCVNGNYDNAWRYLGATSGSEPEAVYPYESGKTGNPMKCRYNKHKTVAKVQDWQDLEKGNEGKLQEALATVGPVAIGIDSTPITIRRYTSGVHYNPECSSSELTHAVLAVGYGTENGKDYWLVKNSWGPKWGLGGFIKMARNKNNNCGVATSAAYVIA